MVFGDGAPKIIYNSSTILLDYCLLESPEWEINEILHSSAISGDNMYIPRGDYINYSLKIHLYKYSNPITKFREIYLVNHKDVTFYPYRNGKIFRDKDGNEVLFHVEQVKLSLLALNDTRDVLTMSLKSLKYIDLEKTLTL